MTLEIVCLFMLLVAGGSISGYAMGRYGNWLDSKSKNEFKAESVRLVLEGGIFIEELEGDKVVARDEIDGELVLKAIIAIVEKQLDAIQLRGGPRDR